MSGIGIDIGSGINSGSVSKPNGDPSALTLTVIDDASIRCDWINGADNQDGTYIFISIDNVTFTNNSTALGALTTKTITGLVPNTTYYVKVAHYKGSKLSEYSNTTYATTYMPFFSDMAWATMGEIIDIEGTKYFKDITPNAIHFPIENYDFAADVVYGFPYKSQATFSAPAGDERLIAADLNNFLYAANGTPNKIPAWAVFNDIDYAHRLFSFHASRVNYPSGEELYEPRVLQFGLYNTEKMGADLSACNTYYSVPTELTSNVKWLHAGASGSTQDGTKNNPYLTFANAVAGASSGDTIYVKTGNYNETVRVNVSKPLNFYGLSKVIKSSTNTTNQFVLSHATPNFTHFFTRIGFDATTVAYHNISDNSGLSGMTYMFNSCAFMNYARGGSQWVSSSSTATFNNCIFTSTRVVLTALGFTVYSATASNVNIFNGNYIKDNSYMGVRSCPTFRYNRTIISGSSNFLYNYYANGIAVDYRFNETISTNSSFTVEKATVYIIGATSIDIGYNRFYSNNIYAYLAINIFGSDGGAETDSCHIYNNYIVGYAHSTHVLSVGTEEPSTRDNKIKNIIIENNTVLCHRYFDPSQLIITHSLYVGFQKDAIIRYNYVNGGGINILYKGTLTTEGTLNSIYGNISVNGYNNDYFVKGISGVKLYNNVAFNNLPNVGGGSGNGNLLYFTSNISGDNPENCEVKNNIIIDVSNAVSTLINIRSTSVLISNNNILYSANGFYGHRTSAQNLSYAQWQAQGFDLESVNENVNFFDVAAWKMWLTAPVRSGASLGGEFENLLDISTDWGSDVALPTVVQRLQGVNKNIGAYVN